MDQIYPPFDFGVKNTLTVSVLTHFYPSKLTDAMSPKKSHKTIFFFADLEIQMDKKTSCVNCSGTIMDPQKKSLNAEMQIQPKVIYKIDVAIAVLLIEDESL